MQQLLIAEKKGLVSDIDEVLNTALRFWSVFCFVSQQFT